MASPEEEFDVYTSLGENFSTDDQVANLLTENPNKAELQARVAECRSTYLTQLQVLLMGYHEDFLVIGHKMKEVCNVVEDLKRVTREGRTAIGDVSAWTLPPRAGGSDGGDSSFSSAVDDDGVFALGDPWKEEDEAGLSLAMASSPSSSWSGRATSSSSAAAGSHPQQSSSAAVGSSSQHQQQSRKNSNRSSEEKIKVPRNVMLPVAYLSRIARRDPTSSSTFSSSAAAGLAPLAAGGFAATSISAARQTERLLQCAFDRVQRRVFSSRQVLALKEIDDMANGAAERVGHASVPLALLRSATMDSFQRDSWALHPLGIGDIEPRWGLLAEAGRFASASALILRTHSALIEDFSSSFVHSSIDVRMSALRLSSAISAVMQHAAELRQSVCGDFDPAALSAWSIAEIHRAVANVFSGIVERKKHTATSLSSSSNSSSSGKTASGHHHGSSSKLNPTTTQTTTIGAVAESVAMDVAMAVNFAPCEEVVSAPLSRIFLRSIQPAQLKLLWDQVQSVISTDLYFAPVDSNDDSLVAQITGAEMLPRQCLVRCLSPTLSGVVQHQGMLSLFDSDAWCDVCDRLAGSGSLFSVARDHSYVLLSSYVADSTNILWDHLVGLLSLKETVKQNVVRAATNDNAVAAHHQSSSSSSSSAAAALLLEQAALQQDLIDFYLSSPDWIMHMDQGCSQILAHFVSSILTYRSHVSDTAKRICCRELEKKLAMEQQMSSSGSNNHVEEATAASGVAPSPLPPPVLQAFKPELFVSTFDVAVAATLSVVASAAHVAGMMLPSTFPSTLLLLFSQQSSSLSSQQKNTTTTTTASSALLTVGSRCANACEQTILRFVKNCVYQRSATTLRTAFSINDLRLRADAGGVIDPQSVAERAALFVLAPYAFSSQGSGEVQWLPHSAAASDNSKSSNSSNSNRSLLVPLTAHKVMLIVSHCHRVGGPLVAAMFATAMASFVCDETAFLSKECWATVKSRAPFLAPLLQGNNSNSHKELLLSAVAAVLYILAPALEKAVTVFPSLRGSLSYDSFVAKVKELCSSSSSPSSCIVSPPPASSPSSSTATSTAATSPSVDFGLVLDQVRGHVPFTASLPSCCWSTLNDLRDIVMDKITVDPSLLEQHSQKI